MRRLNLLFVLAWGSVFVLGFTPVDERQAASRPAWSPQGEPNLTLLNINNITTRVRSDGRFYRPEDTWNGTFPRGTAGVVFTEGILWGGFVNDGQTPALRVNGSTYNTGLVPGAILGIRTGVAEDHFRQPGVRIWRVRRDWQTADLSQEAVELDTTVEAIRRQYLQDWNEWPAFKGAPYDDVDGDGLYNPTVDIPGIPGAHQTIWFVANDIGELASPVYGSPPIGMELQMTLWGYAFPADHPLGNTTFKRVRLIYKGTATTPADATIDSMFICQWVDPDVGDYFDDLVGCDTTRSLIYAYNGAAEDSRYAAFGLVPPAVGYVLLQGALVPSPGDTAIFDLQRRPGFKNLPMTSFLWFTASGPYQDPPLGPYEGTLQWYNLMLGLRPSPGYPNGLPWVSPTNDTTVFPLSGDPLTGTGWIDGQTLAPGERRMGLSTGPFRMALGDTQEVVVALMGAIGDDYLQSIARLRETSDFIQELFEGLFEKLPTSVAEHATSRPTDFQLAQNYPNPFNAATVIRYALPRAGLVTLRVYDVLGREVRTLVHAFQEAKSYSVTFDASDLASGVYLYRLQLGDFVETRKMILIR